ncbi:MAG TPA: hypothetical protein VG817_07725 [Gemmatimonadales bacterium]|nr:hypothetical protein [Gemmatimonadales bacterium]
MMRHLLLLALLLAPASLAAQERSCVFQVVRVGRTGSTQQDASGTNYFGGGGVELTCQGTRVRMISDSVASYGGRIVQFLGNVRYEDSTLTMTADRGTYYKQGEKWEARGRVVTTNRANGSTISGPALDYFRAVHGVRDTVEMYSIGRPVVKSITLDSTGLPSEPYVIVADRIRMRGNERTWAGGKVTIDRSDFNARADSVALDLGKGNRGILIGTPVMKGLGRDSFELHGRRIEMQLENRQVTYVTAFREGHAISTQVDLVADTIGLDIDQRNLVQTLAWGDSIAPKAVTTDYEIRGDSLAFDTPARLLKEVRSFGRGWVGGKVDAKSGDRDWMSGDTVVATFVQWDSLGTTRTTLGQLQGSGSARSFYRVENTRQAAALPSIN